MSTQLVRCIFDEEGIKTSDKNVYKLMSLTVDYLLDEMLESIE